ncbi:MAG: GNAT family N-acetyltransferase [Candidatus Pacebacteria bacterium]|nr:GNAT family N-acetyltransferase [Candidatus Paceibacterota bacterium]
MRDKFEVLSQKMRRERTLLGARLEVDALLLAAQEGRAEVIEHEGKIIAFGALWDREHSVEIGSLWVDQEHRGNRYMSFVFRGLVARAPLGKRLFIIAQDEIIAGLAMKHGMEEEPDRGKWLSRALCQPSCDSCDRLPKEVRSRCLLKFSKPEYRVFWK